LILLILCIHTALLDSFTRVHQSDSSNQLNIAIVEGDATGIELSAERFYVIDML